MMSNFVKEKKNKTNQTTNTETISDSAQTKYI